MLVQLLMDDLDRRARLAEHLQWMCNLLQLCPGVPNSKQCLMLSVEACVFALRQLGCSDAVISWVQDHAEVSSVGLLRCRACCSAKSGMAFHRPSYAIAFCCPFPFLFHWYATGTL